MYEKLHHFYLVNFNHKILIKEIRIIKNKANNCKFIKPAILTGIIKDLKCNCEL